MRKESSLLPDQKARILNLQPTIYGTFAEIGGGQEVVNHFFKAGAASGTIAKSISAYDMAVSDVHYGKTEKYVSKERLLNILRVEYQSLICNLTNRAPITHFFSFGNTVETTRSKDGNTGRGWFGMKYQTAPNSKPHHCLFHVIFHTDDAIEQREILGTLGVNLIYGAFEYGLNADQFVLSLKDSIDPEKMEINYIDCSDGAFKGYNGKKLSFLLVKHGLTKMVLFDRNGEILTPSNYLRKKNIMLIRGRFRPPTKVTMEMFSKTREQMLKYDGLQQHDILDIAEITFNCHKEKQELTLNDFVKRTELLNHLGIPVMITNFKYHSDLIAFLRDFCVIKGINLVLGSENLTKVFNENSSEHTGGSLRFISELIKAKGKVYLFPEATNDNYLLGLDQLPISPAEKELLDFLKQKGIINQVEDININLLKIKSNDVINFMNSGTNEWEEMVPDQLLGTLRNDRFSA